MSEDGAKFITEPFDEAVKVSIRFADDSVVKGVELLKRESIRLLEDFAEARHIPNFRAVGIYKTKHGIVAVDLNRTQYIDIVCDHRDERDRIFDEATGVDED